MTLNQYLKTRRTRMKKKTLVFLALLALVMGLLPLSSQAAEGFYVSTGIGFSFPAMSGDFMDEYNPGSGSALELLDMGYGFTDKFSVGLVYGSAAGGLDNDFDDEAAWGQGYLGLTARYSFEKDQKFVPYIDLGLGSYLFMAMGDDIELVTDSMTNGLRAALGGRYYMGEKQRFFIAPEVSYHYVEYNCDAEIENDVDYSIEFDEDASMANVLFKVGYQWKKQQADPE
jgi:hypothetical protein